MIVAVSPCPLEDRRKCHQTGSFAWFGTPLEAIVASLPSSLFLFFVFSSFQGVSRFHRKGGLFFTVNWLRSEKKINHPPPKLPMDTLPAPWPHPLSGRPPGTTNKTRPDPLPLARPFAVRKVPSWMKMP